MKRTLFSVVLLVAGLGYGGFGAWRGSTEPDPELVRARNEAFQRARVFRDEPFDGSKVDFAHDPNRDVVDSKLTPCKYEPDEISGTSPKFDCTLENGDVAKVKYGWTKEIPSEIATSRLMHALGFGADRVSPVETVRCYGCPFQPYHLRSIAEMLGLDGVLDRHLDYKKYRDFEGVSVERKIDGEEIEVGDAKGWGFYELKNIDPAKGGATREQVDALRLMAVFLHHWDNKTQNQRLVCAGSKTPDCNRPLAMIQDVGSNFGPKKVTLDKWRELLVWSDGPSCTISMKKLPYGGGTFEDVKITDGGRRLLGNRLKQLSPNQLATLFQVARLDDVTGWVATFQDKVRQITERPACPS